MRFTSRAALSAVLGAAVALVAAAAPAAASDRGTVYTSTNSASGNEVLVLDRAGDGSLKPAGSFSTDGAGTGAGLGSEGAIALSESKRFLYVVNAGSDSVSTLVVRGKRLDLLATTLSGGDRPISVTVHRDLLYVLNAADGTIAGFSGARHGELAPIPASTQSITGADPAQVRFSNDGEALVVTNKATNTIDTFAVDHEGRAGPAQPTASEGDTPFGFDFDRRGHLIVSEAAASAVSSYSLAANGSLNVISPAVPDQGAAACWVEVGKSGRFAYVSNTGSGSISSYSVARDGSVELQQPIAAATGDGSAPADLAESPSGRVLLALLPGTGSVASYRVAAHGGLRLVDQLGGVAGTAAGLAAR
jgi:6-phosphogluconolactonase (cycloisomerase 2 family)